MIVSKTPLRMSFVGGGSDMSQFYKRKRGAVLSTAISKYIYITVNKKFDDAVRLAYSINEDVPHADSLEHPLVRTVMRHLGLTNGVEITTIADIPSSGTGLGSSSSFTVGVLNALSRFQNNDRSKDWLAETSCHIEIDLCNEPIGKQDQYAAAFGGLNCIEFLEDDSVRVQPVQISADTLAEFERSIIIFYTGVTRSASAILKQQSSNLANDSDADQAMTEMVAQVHEMKNLLERGELDGVGKLLHEGWRLKRSLAKKISSDQIDDLYARALKAGAKGGKLLGAGAGGFMMFYAPPETHERIRNELSELQELQCGFDKSGSQIILDDRMEA